MQTKQFNSIIKNDVELYQNFGPREIAWNQWLAGIIDGDGNLAIQASNNVAVCEITMPLEDESLLYKIKQKLGGSISSRSKAKTIRYRLCDQKGIENLLQRINGFIRTTIRKCQFKKLCYKFQITYLEAKPLTLNDGYIAGLFDAAGSILISVNKTSPADSIRQGKRGKIIRLQNSKSFNQLRIEITNKRAENLLCLQQAFASGTIRKVHKNSIYRFSNYDLFSDYVAKYPLYSTKMKRVLALKSYVELKRIDAHLAGVSSRKRKAWNAFCLKWYA